jgi:DNA repair exonuclease SbcCD nuclease subunit
MLARGIHEDVPNIVDITEVEPSKKALELNVLKRKPISMSKQIVIKELKRRKAFFKKLNTKNKNIVELFDMLLNETVLEDDDKEFVKVSVTEYLKQIHTTVQEAEERKKAMGGRAEVMDCLHWIIAIDVCGDIHEAYLKLQDVLSWEQLNDRNSESNMRTKQPSSDPSMSKAPSHSPSVSAHPSITETLVQHRRTSFL